MVFSRLLTHESLLGVDIGSSSIKLMHGELTKQGARISHVALCPTPPDSIKDGVVTNIPEVAAAVQFAMRSAGIKASGAVAAIAGPGVIVRHVQLPNMTEQLLRKSIHFEAGKYISASLDESVVEFDILGPAGDDQMNVVLVAAPYQMIDSRVAVLEAAGLEPLAIDVEAFATHRVMVEQSADPSLKANTIALLDMGASRTEINLICQGNLALTRTIPIAGSSLTNAIRSVENLSYDAAEQRKCLVDLSEPLDNPGMPPSSQALRSVQQLTDELLREIRRSINYYQSQLPDGGADMVIDKLILTGGTSRLKGLRAYAGDRLNVDVEIANPFVSGPAQLLCDQNELSEDDIPLFTVALGLLMKELVPAGAQEGKACASR